ncbi:MAG: TfoX/Sxy family DNA transformation protein [Leptospiraceae bacterium]|nr:TfoX/Sxy family DNA transformation protein [Leptospiraceae bacterium]
MSFLGVKNIGKKIGERLTKVGISTLSELKKFGAVEAHRRISIEYHGERLPVCYYLYSFEGAIQDIDWRELSPKEKNKLKKEISNY